MARIIAIDFGQKRVGIAIADPLRMFAQPVGTYTPTEAVARLKLISDEEGIDVAVVGWPLLPDGSEGKATSAVAIFINRLSKNLPGVRIVQWDERYSSIEARDRIKSGPQPSLKKRGRGRIDTAAAGIILEDYLASI